MFFKEMPRVKIPLGTMVYKTAWQKRNSKNKIHNKKRGSSFEGQRRFKAQAAD